VETTTTKPLTTDCTFNLNYQDILLQHHERYSSIVIRARGVQRRTRQSSDRKSKFLASGFSAFCKLSFACGQCLDQTPLTLSNTPCPSLKHGRCAMPYFFHQMHHIQQKHSLHKRLEPRSVAATLPFVIIDD
jgi:hypothetical protein